MKSLKTDARGFTHHFVLVAVVVVVAVAGVFTLVLKSRQDNVQSRTQKTSKTEPGSKLKETSGDAKAGTTPVAANSATKATTSSKTSPPKSSGTSASNTSTSTPTSTSSSPSTQTLIAALTAIISDLQNGSSKPVTANNVTVSGPISDAQARPLVFTVEGQTYFAYTQGSPANFNTSASETANSMAIMKAPAGSPALSQAKLNTSKILVDENNKSVGYSTGGGSTGY